MTSCNCPDPEELRQYAVGMISEERAAALEEHCRTCAECETTVVFLENCSDGVVEALRKPARTQYQQYFADPAFLAAVRKAYGLAPRAEAATGQAPPSAARPRDTAS